MPRDHSMPKTWRRIETSRRKLRSVQRHEQLSPDFDISAERVRVFVRFGSAFMNMHLMRLRLLGLPVPAIDDCRTFVRTLY